MALRLIPTTATTEMRLCKMASGTLETLRNASAAMGNGRSAKTTRNQTQTATQMTTSLIRSTVLTRSIVPSNTTSLRGSTNHHRPHTRQLPHLPTAAATESKHITCSTHVRGMLRLQHIRVRWQLAETLHLGSTPLERLHSHAMRIRHLSQGTSLGCFIRPITRYGIIG